MVKVCGSTRGLEGRRTLPLVGKIRKEEKKGHGVAKSRTLLSN